MDQISRSCFVLMPFATTHSLPEVWEDVIRLGVFGTDEVCKLYACVRADDIFDNKSIIEDIVRLIRQADIIIADLTTRNPNVLYELGRAHEMAKECILITQDITDVPFDLRHLRVLPYTTTGRGLQKLREDLLKTVRTIHDRVESNLAFSKPGHGKSVVVPGLASLGPVQPTILRPHSKTLPRPTEVENWVRLLEFEIEDKVFQEYIATEARRYFRAPENAAVKVTIDWFDDYSGIDKVVALVSGYEVVVYDHYRISDLMRGLGRFLFPATKYPFAIEAWDKSEEQMYTDFTTLIVIVQDHLPTLDSMDEAWMAGLLRLSDETAKGIEIRSRVILRLESEASVQVISALQAFKNKHRRLDRRDVSLAARAIQTIRDRERKARPTTKYTPD